jgi:excisionase family DNA binding protein
MLGIPDAQRQNAMAVLTEHDPITPSDGESNELLELDSLLAKSPGGSVCLAGLHGEQIALPESIYRLLSTMVHELAVGNAVTITPVRAELTTQQAADLLNVSRPFFVNLLESGSIPFHRVGTHRRVQLEDVLRYRQTRTQARRAALAEMAQEAQELGLYE